MVPVAFDAGNENARRMEGGNTEMAATTGALCATVFRNLRRFRSIMDRELKSNSSIDCEFVQKSAVDIACIAPS